VGQQYIVFKQNTRSSQFEGYYLGKKRLSPNDYFTFTVSSSAGASANVTSTTTIQAGVWYHIAATRGPNFVQIFVNGKLEAQASVNFPQYYGPFPLLFRSSGVTYWALNLSGHFDVI